MNPVVMQFRMYGVVLLLLMACATTRPRLEGTRAVDLRFANLQRAAALPWRDEGRCVVQEAAQPWPVVVDRCFHALDDHRVRFRDIEKRCPVASADVATLETMVGICLLTQPELAVGAVVIIGAVVVAVAIHEGLEEYTRVRGPHSESEAQREPVRPEPQEAAPKKRPAPEETPSGRDWPPLVPPETLDSRERRPECIPQPVPHLGGDLLHNQCADKVPFNGFAGGDVLVKGKRFDALQWQAGVLWEVKTDNFDTYSTYLKRAVIGKQVAEMKRERDLAMSCGYSFRVGVLSVEHKTELERADDTLDIIVMDWC